MTGPDTAADEPPEEGSDAAVLARTLAAVPGHDAAAAAAAWRRQHDLTKPRGSLGALEHLAARLAAATGDPEPVVDPVAVAVFAADHGVHARGVSPWPQEVTGAMVRTVLDGGAAVAVLARQAGAVVRVVDVGLVEPPAAEIAPDLVRRSVRRGTGDLSTGQAATREEMQRAVRVGVDTADDLVARGHRLLVAGDLGIANTTASAALVCAFTGAPPAAVTGRGTGVDDATLATKVAVVAAALDLHRPRRQDPLGVLAAVGGLEHAAIAGFLLGAAAHRVPVVLDGVVVGAAALAAAAWSPAAVDHWVAGHRSSEPGATAALEHLGLDPLLDLGMRLGEGTGALLAVPLARAATALLREMATFSGAGIDADPAAAADGVAGADRIEDAANGR